MYSPIKIPSPMLNAIESAWSDWSVLESGVKTDFFEQIPLILAEEGRNNLTES